MTEAETRELAELTSMDFMLRHVRGLAGQLHLKYTRNARHSLIGGVFGSGRFFMGGASSVSARSGLPSVMYFVAEGRCGAMLGLAHSKAGALGMARDLLESFARTGRRVAFDIACEIIRGEQEAEARRAQAEIHGETRETVVRSRKVHSIPRRRRKLFEESGGKCFYCACELDIADKWHVDHKMPRALGGDNDPTNLVVACATCNLSKSDKTDVEFKAALKAESA